MEYVGGCEDGLIDDQVTVATSVGSMMATRQTESMPDILKKINCSTFLSDSSPPNDKIGCQFVHPILFYINIPLGFEIFIVA
ncbi:MAG: hypothetical protein LBQ00_05720 [Syntrophobacterales bacterium]|jgi:hypothetical protein|nr:hypothetical protein [Syntrophobacterales bacterium]